MLIKDYFVERGMSVYQVSVETGIPYSTLSDLVKGKTDIKKSSSDTLYRLSKYLKVSMESLYEESVTQSMVYLSNDGRNVHVALPAGMITYMGPKNLIAFRRIKCVKDDVVYVDAYFANKEGRVYCEEDYIDLRDLCKEYGYESLIADPYTVKISNRTDGRNLIDESLMVSDYMAICDVPNSTGDVWIEVTNVARNKNRLVLRLKDYAIISSNMSESMQKRAIAAVKRNEVLILAEISERSCYA